MTNKIKNIILADFLGWKFAPSDKRFQDWFDENGNGIRMTYGSREPLIFDTNWNWLMKIVEKIEELGNDVLITTNYIQITFDEGEQFILLEDVKIRIETLYDTCVEFVKWYNNKN